MILLNNNMGILMKAWLKPKLLEVFIGERIPLSLFLLTLAMYPSLAQALNICKDTKLMTILAIEGYNKQDIVDLCGHLVCPRENSVYLCNKFLKLPNYKEMTELYRKAKLQEKENEASVLGTS